MRLALAQINAVVGDLEGNRERILAALADARGANADIVLLPELAVPRSCGPPKTRCARSRRRRRG